MKGPALTARVNVRTAPVATKASKEMFELSIPRVTHHLSQFQSLIVQPDVNWHIQLASKIKF